MNISIPNDYNSDDDFLAAIDQCYDGDYDEAESDEFRLLYDELSNAARAAGLTFCCTTDFGADWAGTDIQLSQARSLLPSWAYISNQAD